MRKYIALKICEILWVLSKLIKMKNKNFEKFQQVDLFYCQAKKVIGKVYAVFLLFDEIRIIFLLQWKVLMMVYLSHKGRSDLFQLNDL